MIPFNDLSVVTSLYKKELEEAAHSVINSGWFILGPSVKGFEKSFAEFTGAKYCYGVGNGTDALEIALKSVGVRPGDEVITVANAGFYTSSACINIGAIPVYVDVDDDLLIAPSSVESSISPQTKAIVVTHLYGQAVDVERIKSIASDIPIVEDCAEAHGARIGSSLVGTLGDVAAFSFYPTKNLGALGDAGAVVTNSLEIAENVQLMRQYGWREKYHASVPYGQNSRMDEIQAAFLTVALQHIEETTELRRKILAEYRNAAPAFFSHFYEGERNVAHLAVARMPRRDEFRELCLENEIPTDVHFPVLDCDQEAMHTVVHRAGDLTYSKKVVDEIVTLPLYPGMPSDHVEMVVRMLSKWYEG